jgi:multiple sugar transport system substrate-binding protein
MKTSIFQIIVISIFGAFAVAGVLVFAIAVGGGKQEVSIGTVAIWGTLDKDTFAAALDQVTQANKSLAGVSYEQKDSGTFDQELANALAEKKGPDLYLITTDQALTNESRVAVTPYTAISQTTYKNTFIDAANPFLGEQGIIAVPLATDPLVLYSNRDLLASAGYANPPAFWDEVQDMAQKITVRDTSGSIRVSAIALGTYTNIEDAKAILSALIMQANNRTSVVQDSITGVESDGKLHSLLAQAQSQDHAPAVDAITLYTGFANPSQSYYTWNGSFQSARQAFSEGQVALYIGFASEEPLIRSMNPNLNYAVTDMPQFRGSKRPITFGRTYGFAIPLTTTNLQGAQMAVGILVSSTSSAAFAKDFRIASADRDVLDQSSKLSQDDAFIAHQALIAKNWVDPDPAQTDAIFRDMIETTVSGASTVSDSLSRADQKMQHAVLRE